MQIDLEQPGDVDLYELVTHVVMPRPIAWVSSLGPGELVNLAPFSYFGVVSDDPIVLMLSIGRRRGEHKDTARNLLTQGEAVIHMVEAALLEPMLQSSKELPPSESEIDYVGLLTVPSTRVCPPRLERASVALECRLDRHIELGPEATDLFLLRAVYAHMKDAALIDGMPDPQRLGVVGKLGGNDYAITDRIRTLKRR